MKYKSKSKKKEVKENLIEEKTKLERQNGITLVALIVTIIVLLILAAVSIATLTGENGILTRANDAKEKTARAEKEEKTNLSKSEDFINEYVTGIEVEQVTDENPGILEIDENDGNTYIINSIEDLVFFAYDVTSGNTYKEKTVKLGLSLDFNSTKSYIDPFRTDYAKYGYNGELKTLLTSGPGFSPIGAIEDQLADENFENAKAFKGKFDGCNNTISNLYMNRFVIDGASYQYFGLFSQNLGIIENLSVNGSININVAANNVITGLISGIVIGENSKIENCFSNGKINVNGQNLSIDCYMATGGIVGQINVPDGQVKKCGNSAEIAVNGERNYVGGIVGSINGDTTKVTMSYNTGKIIVNGNNDIFTRCGGVAGTNASGFIEHCYNIGEVIGNEGIKIGGILGFLEKNGTIINCQYSNKDILGTGILTHEQEEANSIIRKESLTINEILNILEKINN